MRSSTAACVLTLCTVLLTGCGSTGAQSAADATAESSTLNSDVTGGSGRPPIAFDPCLDIPDDVITRAGYDPASKELTEYPLDGYTFRRCDIKTPVRKYTLSVLSGNVTFAEEQKKTADYAQPIDINGRRALLKLEATNIETCAISLETTYGILILLRTLNFNDIGYAPQEQWCAGLEDTARLIEPLLAD